MESMALNVMVRGIHIDSNALCDRTCERSASSVNKHIGDKANEHTDEFVYLLATQHKYLTGMRSCNQIANY